MPRRDTLAAASGRWPQILADLAGVTPEQLCRREGPCPNCGGSTRFRWDQDEGDGAWHCSHCGGKDSRGGGGNGIDLLCRIQGWTFAEAAAQVDLHLGRSASRGATGPRPRQGRQRRNPPPAAAAAFPPPSERLAFEWLEAAGELADGEGFSPGRASGGAYTSRWFRWAGDNPDAAAAIVLEHTTTEGLNEAPPPEEPEPLDAIGATRTALGQAVARGASTADLEELIGRLSSQHEQPASTVRALLRALQQEHHAREAMAAGRHRLEVAADRAEVGQALITLDSLFPASLAQAIRIRMQDLPSDDISSAALILAAAAGVTKIGTEIIAKQSANFRVPLNLFVALVGRSGAKKGPGQRLLLDAQIDPIAIDMAQQHARAMAQWRRENHGRKGAERSEQPLELRIRASKWTSESLDAQLAALEAAGLGLLLSREELAAVFSSLGQYKNGRGDDAEQLLEVYDGRGTAALRITADGGGRFYARCQVSICGSIQPTVLQRLLAASEGDATGLWARFLFVPLPERVVAIPPEETQDQIEASEAAAALLVDVIGRLFRMPRQSLRLSPEARHDFLAYEARCQGDALRAELPAQQACWGKAAGKALRVGGLVHLLHAACPDGRHSEEVQPWAVQQACNLVDHLTGWTLGLHAAAAGDDDPTDLMRLIHRLAGLGSPVGWREVSGRLSRRQRQEIDSAAARAAAEALAALGHGEIREHGRRWVYAVLGDLPG